MTVLASVPSHKLQMLVLKREDPSRDMARYHVMAIETTLFGSSAT